MFPAGLLTIREAAALLAVSVVTLRRWDANGVLRARRHPINGYRMYRRAEVLEMKRRILGAAK